MYVEFMIGITVAGNDSDKENSKKVKLTRKDIFMTVTMLLAIIGAGPVLWDLISPGEVRPIPPSGYSIIRGVEFFSFPSDHIVLPIDWEYTGGTPAVITHPYLVFREIDDNGNEKIGKQYKFYMAGVYPDISSYSFEKCYIIKESFILDPHAITSTVIVFHIEPWWDPKNEFCYNFRFQKGQIYSVYINFERELKYMPEDILFIEYLYIPDRVDDLRYDRVWGNWWDWFRIEYQKDFISSEQS
jgi:hypothetical protein